MTRGFHQSVRFRGFGQGEGRVDDGSYAAHGQQGPDIPPYSFRDHRLLRNRAWPKRRAGEREALDHDLVHQDLGTRSTEYGDYDDAALNRRGFDVALYVGAGNHVENDVCTFPVGGVPDDFDEVLGPIVDPTDRAQRFAEAG